MNVYQKKYTKYKNKYLNLKKQLGGADDEYPQTIFNSLIANNCLKETPLILDGDIYEKLRQFFSILKNTYKTIYLPNDTITTENFIGKLSFTRDDIEKIYAKLEEKPSTDAKLSIAKTYYKKKDDSRVEIDNFIIIKDTKVFIGLNEIDDYRDYDKNYILTDIVQNSRFKTFFNNSKIDDTQFSAQADYIRWQTFDGTISDFNKLGSLNFDISGHNQYFNYYKKDKIYLIYKIINTEINYCMMNIEELDDGSYKLFPYSYNNFMINSNFESPIITLFENIKNTMNNIYQSNINKSNSVYSYIDNILLGNLIKDSKEHNTQLKQIDLFNLPEGHDLRKNILTYYYNTTYTLDIFGIPDETSIDINGLNESESLDIFNNLYQSTSYKEFLEESKNYYKNLPDYFFHLHVTLASEKYILLTAHADLEITSQSSINYIFKDKEGVEHKNTRREYPKDQENKNKLIKTHNFYVLFNLNENSNKMFSVNNLTTCYDSIFLTKEGIAFPETIFGSVIGDLNHIQTYGAFYTAGKKQPSYFVTETGKVYAEKSQNQCNILNGCSENNIITGINNGDTLHSTDGKQPYPMKCSEFHIIEKDGKKILFIDDILVSWDYKNCNVRDFKFGEYKGANGIIKNIEHFAKINKINRVELDDNSFVQIPQQIYSTVSATFFYALIYLQTSPKKHSIYSNKFGYINYHMEKDWYCKLLDAFEKIVEHSSSKYNLLEESTKILKLPKPIREDNEQYRKFKIEYKNFEQHVVCSLSEYLQLNNFQNIKEILEDKEVLENDTKDINEIIKEKLQFSSFHNFLAFFNLERYYKIL
jgi:hypothetical protein